MDAGPVSPIPSPQRQHGKGGKRVALVLQGGGALGAYQGGVYQALHEAGLEPDWIAGISMGAINGAIIAGNPPERRLDRLRAFWETITARPVYPFLLPSAPERGEARKLFNVWSSLQTMLFGQPGFFAPRLPGPWLSPPGSKAAISFYDDGPLRATLRELVDFERINQGPIRYAAGAVNIAAGESEFFDSARQRIGLDHVMASAALPPALPMVALGGASYWDGGVVSNTPLGYLLEHPGSGHLLVFQIDLFSAAGPVPSDMFDVLARQKDILYASRSRLVTRVYTRLHQQKVALRSLLEKLPEAALDPAERRLKQELQSLPEIALLHLTYQESADEGEAKDYDFSAASMRKHWAAGHRESVRMLARKNWLDMPGPASGIVVRALDRGGEHVVAEKGR